MFKKTSLEKNVMTALVIVAAALCLGAASCERTKTVLQGPVIIAPSQPPVNPIQDGVLDKVKAIASDSVCSGYKWNNRGALPKAYFRGMALVYAKAYCNKNASNNKLLEKPQSGNDLKDALSWYKSNFSNVGLDTSSNGIDNLKSTYTLLIGLGARESSGQYCSGRDLSAGFTASESAEAGLFQASWGCSAASSEMVILFEKYTANTSKCYLDTFSENVSCGSSDAKTWGDGRGADYQKLAKSCPAFAVEYAAVALRINGGTQGEFGPIRKKAAELNTDCEDMLTQVQNYIDKTPKACDSF